MLVLVVTLRITTCIKLGCIYEIVCDCGRKYVGEIGGPLAARIKEHMQALNNPSLKSYVDAPRCYTSLVCPKNHDQRSNGRLS